MQRCPGGEKGGRGSRGEGPKDEGLRRARTRFEKVAALSLPEGECPLTPGFGDGRERARTRQRNGLRGKEHPAPEGQAEEKESAFSAPGGAPRRESCKLTPRLPQGTNCSTGPHGRLRLLTDGACPRRLQLPEAHVSGPRNAWHHRPLPYPGVSGRAGEGQDRDDVPSACAD